MVKNELFYSTRKDIVQTQPFAALLSVESGPEFQVQFRYKKKATAKYLIAINGEKSMARVTLAERVAGRGIDATNSISESLHASSTHVVSRWGVQYGWTIAPQSERHGPTTIVDANICLW